ncbi:MAG: type VI secretion system contractile sheath small subunit [Phycisphaerales bacterium]
MATKKSGQKFIARNRAPRVQVEYDVELYGAEKTVNLPFVMGVMADLSGKPAEALPNLEERKFLDIDVDNFDDRLKAAKPRVAFQVPNTLTGEGSISVDLTFESMDDFSPAAVAAKVDALNKLLQARTQLSNLLTYMDGKSGAEELVARMLQDEGLLKALTAAPKPQDQSTARAQEERSNG